MWHPLTLFNVKHHITHHLLNPIHLKHASQNCRICLESSQLLSSCAFAEVLFEREAAVPGLDFVAAFPELQVDGFGGCENFS